MTRSGPLRGKSSKCRPAAARLNRALDEFLHGAQALFFVEPGATRVRKFEKSEHRIGELESAFGSSANAFNGGHGAQPCGRANGLIVECKPLDHAGLTESAAGGFASQVDAETDKRRADPGVQAQLLDRERCVIVRTGGGTRRPLGRIIHGSRKEQRADPPL